jgi:two-component system NtrC family sensor kinase
VDIRSGDEFESLGDAFNEMSRKLEEGRRLLEQSAKMGAMGQMAAGIVHEIGQPLTTIYGLIELLLMENPDEDSRKHLEIIQEQMDRLRDIIARFRTFTRVSKEELLPLSINKEIEVTHKLLEHQLQMRRIGWTFKKGEELPSILGDSNMLQQVFTNLIINAMDALEEKKGKNPEICIRTYENDHQVFVDIEDNGPGIPKEIQGRIFDPFFTTKGEDKGTGLGLAIIDSIIHQHHARIALESEPGVGTKFIISFEAMKEGSPPQ